MYNYVAVEINTRCFEIYTWNILLYRPNKHPWNIREYVMVFNVLYVERDLLQMMREYSIWKKDHMGVCMIPVRLKKAKMSEDVELYYSCLSDS